MYATSLGEDSAELRPLESWRAEEFLARMDRGRGFTGQHIALPDAVTDLETSRSFLQAYAKKEGTPASPFPPVGSDAAAAVVAVRCPAGAQRSGAAVLTGS
ncbi:hypothetical protein [Streptomyces sp. 8N706]|uniref:hypothetical protein n=1 Tax=Streptomyces sp. 8N706 TaxID=3457416 RepID=UPI003FD668F8